MKTIRTAIATIRAAIANWLIRLAFRAAPDDYVPPGFLRSRR